MQRVQRGFTLIELMIAVALVAVLVAIAVPSYRENIAKTKRGEAQSALLGLAQAMERVYANNGSYCTSAGGTATSCTSGAPTVFSTTVPTNGGTPYYNLRITALTANDYTLQAQIIATGSMKNDKCGALTLTANGTQGITGAAPATVAICWRK